MSGDIKRFADALATGADWRAAVTEAAAAARAKLGRGPCDLALVFVSELWKDFDARELPALLGRELAPRCALGCNAAGAIAGRREVERKPAVAVLAMRLPGARVLPFSLTGRELERMENGGALVSELDLYPTDKPKFLALCDPLSVDPERFAALFSAGYPGAPLVGGLASGLSVKKPSWLLAGGDILVEGAACVALTGDVELDVVVAQGCRPIGEPLTVTSADGNVLQGLGGRPPLEVLREILARCTPEDQRLARESLFAGVAMAEGRAGYGRGDFLIRNLLGIDADSGALMLGAPLRRGQTLQFQLRDARTSDQDMQTLLAQLPPADAAPRGALLVSCLGRGAGLYGKPDHDATLVQSLRGPLPLAGFFANGEFGPVGGRNFIHGYTSCLAIVR